MASLNGTWAVRPIALPAGLVHHWLHVPEVEPHEYQLGSPPASIVGIADMLLRRENLDPDVRTHVTAIRDLALDMVREAERVGGASEHVAGTAEHS